MVKLFWCGDDLKDAFHPDLFKRFRVNALPCGDLPTTGRKLPSHNRPTVGDPLSSLLRKRNPLSRLTSVVPHQTCESVSQSHISQRVSIPAPNRYPGDTLFPSRLRRKASLQHSHFKLTEGRRSAYSHGHGSASKRNLRCDLRSVPFFTTCKQFRGAHASFKPESGAHVPGKPSRIAIDRRDERWNILANLQHLQSSLWRRGNVDESSTALGSPSHRARGPSQGVKSFGECRVELEAWKKAMGCTWSGLHALSSAVGGGGEIYVNKRKFRILRQIGEGGFAFVFLVRELNVEWSEPHDASVSEDGLYAVKKVLIQSEEQLAAVKHEIEASQLFHHPNLLSLIDSNIIHNEASVSMKAEAYLLFPLHREGTLLDHLTRNQSEKKFFPAITVLYIFQQICAGLKHMHTHDPPYAHNDMKPGNVLLSLPKNKTPVAVIMDFGSATLARKEIHNRKEAMEASEWASVHCTAPYRAPELWDTPSETVLDERTDIWALGCTLYAIMYGMSPFEYSLGEQGGSLHLAAISGVVKWPPGPSPPYPETLHQFVKWMVNPSVASRPYIQDVCLHVDKLIAKFNHPNSKGEARGLWPMKANELEKH